MPSHKTKETQQAMVESKLYKRQKLSTSLTFLASQVHQFYENLLRAKRDESRDYIDEGEFSQPIYI